MLQNLVNKFWFRTDDNFTIDEIIKQLGKEEKSVLTKSISEMLKKQIIILCLILFLLKIPTCLKVLVLHIKKDFYFLYLLDFFSCELETFSCLAFISTGSHIIPAQKLILTPYFKERS